MSMASASFILYHVYPDDDGERELLREGYKKMEKCGLLPNGSYQSILGAPEVFNMFTPPLI